ncbi:MAG: phosphoribosylglycinamide formyltransferase [Candidatus Raymondbacteria bacterium RifOxyA12_full_50_37]|uniref:Phosphoribosylglycinamide formyltransferase n=1 Tax=Candidatus Raymondbacteria bacterium RIFOXYD12_FULL_49_13 TaxID=1817890 RepID=A0A1F7F5U5_UNCRA|nr:MAG: phosphoribosylglycinamide formyltransferase [Candidatus Raymondbacteria bacterium RifOxyA12_full_50_37]OGJ89164.1 MAG: phosphoribosylglycinamide formyltransferase [Candidatus Raymondbacteria bacterium RIFOXYA2_FULL_49_16]OGJ96646.1 MAG: phosphoribosylglycinamide formyltransferase [Candidatus Raymondbacteria bacterium RIFOXYC2_FULL_50_21]OGK01958.1 MAG: phosphoribosylglycinamide formyltransferase [Candidatus Raymondbacteria bacterium RIFOXYD12_FULL_49_13]OGK04570.1 MAG: phosphoribosylgly
MATLAVFCSGGGSNLQSIIDNVSSGRIPARIGFVLSNNSVSRALERARKHAIPAIHFSGIHYPGPAAYEQAMLKLLEEHAIDIICLAGYMKLVPAQVIRRYQGKILNIHPALLPKFGGKGMYGIHVHAAVIAAKEKESGATVHFVTEQYDDGPVIVQQCVPVLPGDTAEQLAERVLAVEHAIYPEAILRVVSGKASMPKLN